MLSLVSAAEQHDYSPAVATEINAVARAPVDSHLVDAIAKKLRVPEVPDFEPFEPSENAGPGLAINPALLPEQE